MEERIIIYKKKGRNTWYIIGSVLFSFFSFIFFLLGREFYDSIGYSNDFLYWLLKIIFIVGTLFFPYCAWYYIKGSLHPKPVLIVDEQGVTDQSSALAFGFISWQDINRIYAIEFMQQVYIELELRDEEKYLKSLSIWKRKTISINKKMGFQAVSIVLNATGVNPYDLVPVMKDRMIKAHAMQGV